jgi:phosphate transport system protein
VTRERYLHELEALNADVARMAETAAGAVRTAVEALIAGDVERGLRVVSADDSIDAMHLELEERCMRLLALQQPMASDLRAIASALAITIDLERMADHAEGIGKSVKRLAELPPIELPPEISQMAAQVQEMARDAVTAFLRRDTALAATMAYKDDQVDGLRSRAFRRLLQLMIETPALTPAALEVLLVTQNLERAADHLTNIGEQVIYIATGELKELNV